MPASPVLCSVLVLAAVAAAALGSARAELDVALYASLLERHTRAVPDIAGTRVDYSALKGSKDWRRLLASLEQSQPSSLRARPEKLAFWINAYNILAIDTVLSGYPLESIRDLGGFLSPVWGRDAGSIEGRVITLEEIEHQILRPLGEPRIHAAIVCASLSCPSLRREPWLAATLDAQFDDTLRGFIASSEKGLKIDRSRRRLEISKIFDWFEEDFAEVGGVRAFVARYATDADAAWLSGEGTQATLGYLDYDWTLNDLATRPRQ